MFPRSSLSRRNPTAFPFAPPPAAGRRVLRPSGGVALAALLTLSCAAPAELARRSESAHSAGNDRQAWE